MEKRDFQQAWGEDRIPNEIGEFELDLSRPILKDCDLDFSCRHDGKLHDNDRVTYLNYGENIRPEHVHTSCLNEWLEDKEEHIEEAKREGWEPELPISMHHGIGENEIETD
ncbi:MAG: hypothetical protein EBU88_11670 [Acidobacteria bacterium]|nr:hypothetical protein [Acidobacteriota bacterium]